MNASDASSGLDGIVAGRTALSTVSQTGVGLTYRGYRIEDLAAHTAFEEVAHLLLYGELPTREELIAFVERLEAGRTLPAELRAVLEQLPASTHPMDVLRTGCSALGCCEPERSFADQHAVAERLLAAFPSMLLYWDRFQQSGQQIETQTEEPSLAGHFLQLLHGTRPDDLERRALDVSLILYAEHEFNASTFSARVTASTLSDLYSAITAAIGTLRGPLHGGANEAAMSLMDSFADPESAERGLLERLARKEKVMGFGHRVYKGRDPRSDVIQVWAKQLCRTPIDQARLAVAERIESVMQREKHLFPNVDFYSAIAYSSLRIPRPCSRRCLYSRARRGGLPMCSSNGPTTA